MSILKNASWKKGRLDLFTPCTNADENHSFGTPKRSYNFWGSLALSWTGGSCCNWIVQNRRKLRLFWRLFLVPNKEQRPNHTFCLPLFTFPRVNCGYFWAIKLGRNKQCVFAPVRIPANLSKRIVAGGSWEQIQHYSPCSRVASKKMGVTIDWIICFSEIFFFHLDVPICLQSRIHRSGGRGVKTSKDEARKTAFRQTRLMQGKDLACVLGFEMSLLFQYWFFCHMGQNRLHFVLDSLLAGHCRKIPPSPPNEVKVLLFLDESMGVHTCDEGGVLSHPFCYLIWALLPFQAERLKAERPFCVTLSHSHCCHRPGCGHCCFHCCWWLLCYKSNGTHALIMWCSATWTPF